MDTEGKNRCFVLVLVVGVIHFLVYNEYISYVEAKQICVQYMPGNTLKIIREKAAQLTRAAVVYM